MTRPAPSPPAGRTDRRTDGQPGVTGVRPLRVCVVCSGNICRSPIAEKMLLAAVRAAGLDSRVEISSGGTGGWHVGQGADPRARDALHRAGLDSEHRARRVDRAGLAGVDLVLAADRGHLRDLRRLVADPARVRLLRSFDPDADATDLPDPYYGGDDGFDATVTMVAAALPGILDEIRLLLRRPDRAAR